jgi:hypothetical protein
LAHCYNQSELFLILSTKPIAVSISIHLPMRLVTSFERLYQHGQDQYSVLFEGKSQIGSRTITHWYLTLRKHDVTVMNQYIFHKENDRWLKAIGINALPEEMESQFLPWAAASME